LKGFALATLISTMLARSLARWLSFVVRLVLLGGKEGFNGHTLYD